MDQTMPLALLSGKFTPSFYQGSPITDATNKYFQTQELLAKRKLQDQERQRIEQVRSMIGESLKSGQTVGKTGAEIAGLDPELGLKMIEMQSAQDARVNKPDTLIDDIRSTHNTYLNYLTALVNQGAQADDPRVLEAKQIVSDTAQELRKRGLPIGLDAQRQPAQQVESDSKNIELAKAEALPIIQSLSDPKKIGTAQNRDAVYAGLDKIASKYNINLNSKEWQSILNLLKVREDTIDREARAYKEREEKQYSRKRALYKDMAEAGSILYGIKNLRENPNSISAKSSILTSVLRKESGAAIGKSEYLGRMRGWLDSSDYLKLLDEMTSLGIIAAGYINSNAPEAVLEKISNKYLDKVSAKQIDDFAIELVQKDVRDAYFKENKVESIKQDQPQEGSRLDRIRRLRGML